MIRRPPISTRTDTLFPYTTLFRSWRDMIRTGASRSAGNCRSVPDRRADPRARRVERFGERIKLALLALDARREDIEERDRLAAEGRPVGRDPLARPFIVIGDEMGGEIAHLDFRADEPREGKEWVSTCRSRGATVS